MTEISTSPPGRQRDPAFRDQPLGGHSLRLVMLVLGLSPAGGQRRQPFTTPSRCSGSSGTRSAYIGRDGPPLVVTVHPGRLRGGPCPCCLPLGEPAGETGSSRRGPSWSPPWRISPAAGGGRLASVPSLAAARTGRGEPPSSAQVLVSAPPPTLPRPGKPGQVRSSGMVTGGLLLGIMAGTVRSPAWRPAAAWGWQSIYAISGRRDGS